MVPADTTAHMYLIAACLPEDMKSKSYTDIDKITLLTCPINVAGIGFSMGIQVALKRLLLSRFRFTPPSRARCYFNP